NTNQKTHNPYCAKKMHGTLTKLAHKKYRQQIQKTLDKASGTKLGRTILARVVLHDLLLYIAESGPFRDDRDIPVHLTIHLYAFDDIFFISFQSTIEVMQIMDTGHPTCHRIE